MNRIPAVVRMHLTDRVTIFGLPPAILAASFAVNLAVFAAEPVKSRSSGGVAAIFVVLVVAAVLMTARAMTFTLSMGASRRSFAAGTGLIGAELAVAFGLLLLVLNRVERATGGWGLHGHFFSFGWLDRQNIAAGWLLATLLLLAMFLVGAFASTIWLRWRQLGLLVGGVALLLVVGGLIALVTWRHDWSSLGHWFAVLTPLAAAGWTALLCAVLAGTSYLAVRRVEV